MSNLTPYDRAALADWLEERAHSIRRTEADMKMYERCVGALRSEKRAQFDLEGKMLNVLRLADELTDAVENEALDVGGYRPSGEILRELGPAVDAANAAVKKAGKEIAHG